jgi:nitrous oxide reductase accessory protein NosL
MKKHCAFGKMVFLTAILLSGPFFAMTFAVLAGGDDVVKHPSCPYCGMDRAKFAHCRIYVEYNHDTSMGTCSLHCACLDMALKIDKSPRVVMVGDYYSKELIDVEKAFWVIGGDKMGVMTKRAKWAFETKEDADRFINEHGGKPARYDDAVKASFEDMYEDIKIIRKRRQMRKMRKK